MNDERSGDLPRAFAGYVLYSILWGTGLVLALGTIAALLEGTLSSNAVIASVIYYLAWLGPLVLLVTLVAAISAAAGLAVSRELHWLAMRTRLVVASAAALGGASAAALVVLGRVTLPEGTWSVLPYAAAAAAFEFLIFVARRPPTLRPK